ncbi:MAG: hypothetical protein ACRDJ4_01515 [Actinomycetota bacterium]
MTLAHGGGGGLVEFALLVPPLVFFLFFLAYRLARGPIRRDDRLQSRRPAEASAPKGVHDEGKM